jgi:hypothetical protein
LFFQLRFVTKYLYWNECLWEIKTPIKLWVKLQQMGMQCAANLLLQFIWVILFFYMWHNGSLVAENKYLMVMCYRSVSTGIILVCIGAGRS